MGRGKFDEKISIWMKFGRRTVIWWCIKKSNNIQCLCKCDCWTIRYKSRSILLKNKKPWCNKCRDRSNYGTHKMSKTKLYKIYINILWRCNNKNNPSYKYYWWRGVKAIFYDKDFYVHWQDIALEHLIIMYASIQDEPITFLISVLK